MARTKDFDEDEILTKAMFLFWNKGYNGTSMQDLVDDLGISRSSLYDTYTDKHTLFVKSLEHYSDTASANMQAAIAGAASAKGTIRSLLNFSVEQLTRDPEHKGCFLVNSAVELASHDEEINRMLCRNDRQMEDLLREAVAKGQATGEIKNQQEASAIARFIFNNIKGMRVTARSGVDKKTFTDIADMVMSALA